MKIKLTDELTHHIIGVLQHYQDLMEGGLELPNPNPFYIRNNVLTPAVVDSVVQAVEDEFIHELVSAYSYHTTHNRREGEMVWPEGVKLVRPGFTELPPDVKLALVQDLDAVMQEYRVEEEVPPPHMEGGDYDLALDYSC